MKIAVIGLVAVLLLVLIIGAIAFPIVVRNGLIAKDEAVSQAWAEIDNQLKRRVDLIPNLVETVKGYAAHEKDVFTAVADARSRLLAAHGPAETAGADAALGSALGRLLAIAENYPNLKADTSFVRLQDELAGTENRIAVARGRYNEAARVYNTAMRRFPGSLFASGMERKKAEYYEAPESRDQLDRAPKVKF